jgi:hypothetical protein
VRRRPEEDDQEEPERGQPEVPGRGGVADERWHRARSAADDDVLRCRALQPAGVDEDVEEVPDERQRGREHIHGARQEHEGERRERESELEASCGRDAARGDGPLLGARAHQAIDVGVEHVVERTRAAAGQREAGHRRQEEPAVGDALRTDEHPGGAREQQQRHDSRLRQRDVVPPGTGLDGIAAEALDAQHQRRCERERGEQCVKAGRGHERGEAEEDERDQRRDEQSPMRDPRCDDERHERRQCERGEQRVRCARAEGAGDDSDESREGGPECGQAQPGPGGGIRAHRAPSTGA